MMRSIRMLNSKTSGKNPEYLSFLFRNTCWMVLILLLLMRSLSAGEIIVKFKDQLKISITRNNNFLFSESSLNQIFSQYDLKYNGSIFPNQAHHSESALKNIIRVQLNPALEISTIISELRNNANIDWIEPNYRFRVHFQPDDSLYFQQWALTKLQLPEAWDIEQGDPEIIVGVIDTGVDYFHFDLQGQLWINTPEDLNGNDRLDTLDLNGIDDDGNGYVDDVIGWDFTDAPQFPDDGDYLEPDNDPRDEYPGGHGTPIAGIIAAVTNNHQGIAGIAPGIRVMILRAGTAAGYLEEDDVAEAIIYAVDNGCKIINMSFGDIVFSHLLKEAVDYGFNRGVLFVASAGNSGNQLLHYPAAYDQTIAVGATDSTARLASFSNYGSKIDVVAPGHNILCLSTENSFGKFSGTSFAAPMVSGVLGLIWSREKTASAQQIWSQLIAGCIDLGTSGWDSYFGHGEVNAYRSLMATQLSMAQIDFPETGNGVCHQNVAVRGSAAGADFREYCLNVGIGTDPLHWTLIEQNDDQVIHDTLGIWDTAQFPDTLYTIELKVFDWNQHTTVQRVIVNLDRTAPELMALNIIPMVVEDYFGYMIEIVTDDQTIAQLHYRELGQVAFNFSILSNYFSSSHNFLITQQESLAELEFYLELENNSGLKSDWDNQVQYYRIDLRIPSTFTVDFELLSQFPGSGYFLSKSIDCNYDGISDVFGNISWPDLAGSRLSSLNLFNQEVIRHVGAIPAFARDLYDVDNDGFPDLLAGYGASSFLFAGHMLPELTKFPITATEPDFWASRLYDVDGDGSVEVIALHQNQWNVYRLLDAQSFSLIHLQTLDNPTSGDNLYGIPHVEIADLNYNSELELIIGDYDGDLLIYERDFTGEFLPIATTRLAGTDATHCFAVGDFNGDGQQEIVIATQKLAAYNGESAIQKQYWILNILSLSGSGIIRTIWQQSFYGIGEGNNALSGVSVADYDQDGKDEIFFTPFPRAYYLQNENDEFQINWYHSGINSSAVPLLAEGQILISGDSTLMIWEIPGQTNRPYPPASIKIIKMDTNLVELQWGTVSGADGYHLTRTDVIDQSIKHFDCYDTSFTDTSVIKNYEYDYQVQTIDSTFIQPLSRSSQVVRIRAESPPEFNRFEILNSSQLSLEFNKPLGFKSFQVDHFNLYPDSIAPLSTLRGKASQQIILGFQSAFAVGWHVLVAVGLVNHYGIPIPEDSLIIPFEIHSDSESPYVQKVEMISKKELFVFFNHPMEATSAEKPTNYYIEPDDEVIEARLEQGDASKVRLYLSGRNRMGSLGENYYLIIREIKDVWGKSISTGIGNRFLILKAVEDLDNLVVFPNPLRSDATELKITFGNLPVQCQISIFTPNGRLLITMKNENFNGGMDWDLRNNTGEAVANGVYLYLAEYQDQKKMGKFLISR
jgi:subtilisin family serine protease